MRNIRFWLPVVLWMMVIFSFSSRQKVAFSESFIVSFLFFKTLHLIEYFFLYLVTYRALKNTRRDKKHIWIITFCIVGVYAISDEVHQWFVPTREGKLRDVIIDMFAGGLAWVSLKHWLPILPKKLKNLAKLWQLL